STWLSLAKGLLEVVVGILAGGFLGVVIHFFPSEDQADLVLRRSCMLLGLSVFCVFVSHVAGLGGAGGLSTLVLSFIAGMSWSKKKPYTV
ncbi:sodium/hydrogen exchanger 9B2, partial [Silurus asotus]